MSWVERWRNRTPRVTARRFVKHFGQMARPSVLLDSFQLSYVGDGIFLFRLTFLRQNSERLFKVKDGCPHCVMLGCIKLAAEAFAWPDWRLSMLRTDYELKLGLGIQQGISTLRPDEAEMYVAGGWPCISLSRDGHIDTPLVCSRHRR